jgi:carbon monoxide dehydrogenase subunit G
LVRIDYEFTVGVPVDQAWGRLLDLGKIAPCLPGAAIQEQTGGNEYAGTIRVEIGPITVGYKGTVMFEEIDVADHRAVLHATGRETRGQGTATATIVSTLHDEGEVTMVTVETDLRLTGRAAQFGRGLAQDVAKGMLDEFAVCLEREISGENAGQPAAAEEISTGAAASVDASPVADVAGSAGWIAGGEGTSPTGATVEGAIVAGSSPSEAAASAPPPPYSSQRSRRYPPASLGRYLEPPNPIPWTGTPP